MESISVGRSTKWPWKDQIEDFLGETSDKEKKRKIVTEDYFYHDRLYRSNIK